MRLENYLVPVSNITCNTPCSYATDVLQRSAQLIIKTGGVVNPPILRKNGMSGFYDTYEVVDGCFEYYAAVAAAKLENKADRLINAYIITPDQEQDINAQIAIFRQGVKPEFVVPQSANSNEQTMQPLLDAIKTQLDVVTKQMNALLPIEGSVKTQINALSLRIEQRLSVVEDKIAKLEQPKAPDKPLKDTEATRIMPTTFIDFLNSATAQDIKDLKAGVQTKALQNFVDEQAKGPFESKFDFTQRLKGKGFTSVTYDKLQNAWELKNPQVSTSTANTPNKTEEPQVPEETATTVTTTVVETVSESTTALDAANDAQSETSAPATIAQQEQPTLLADAPAAAAAVELVPDVAQPALLEAATHSIDNLNNISKEELAVRLSRLKIKKPIIQAILDQRPFASFDAMNVPGLGKVNKDKIMGAFETI